MRRNPDLERAILLAVEAFDPDKDPEIDLTGFSGHSDRQVSYQVSLLAEAGLLKACELPDTEDGDRIWCVPQRLTMAGHEYLDAVRDDEVWRRTKDGARAVGSFSLEVLGALARGMIRDKLRQYLGIELDL
ncbi:MAG: DUF2513 domain-containing protein [Amaricoccus sp.]|uniref:DUF2513 domain-containing protein n=1 Tax=Amaricoccus sp. TaxID=1872485 RepID=UPI003315D56C